MVDYSKRLANILLIDDSLGEVILSQAVLRRDHIHLNFSSVRSGEEAMNYLRQQGHFHDIALPHLILLDLNMPDIGGKEILSDLKKDTLLQDIPVIIYSGSDAAHDIKEAKALGAVHYMIKTISYEKLKKAIQYIKTIGFEEKSGEYYLIRKGS